MYPDTQKLKPLEKASLAKFWNKLLYLSDKAVDMQDAKSWRIVNELVLAPPAKAQ